MKPRTEPKDLWSLLIPAGLALFFLLWGLMIFFMVGDRPVGQWYYGSVPDVPGLSPFSTEKAKLFPGSGPERIVRPVRPQHVDGSLNDPRMPFREEMRNE